MNLRDSLLALCLLTPLAAGAQTPAADIQRGILAYQNLNVEAAKNIFTGIINSKQQVTNDQKVTAYQYLGGIWAVSGKPDSALTYFSAAVSNDPFLTALDTAGHFATDEQNAFNRAKLAVWGVGIRPVIPFKLDPNSSDPAETHYTFEIVSTHSARLEVELVHMAPDSTRETIATFGSNEGLRPFQWSGLLNTQLADTGLYELRLTGTDRTKNNTPIVEKQKFRITYVRTPLEDTLPDFKDVRTGGIDTLTSRRSVSVPISNGINAGFLTGLAVAMPFVVLGKGHLNNMSAWNQHFGVGLALGLASGVGTVSYALSHKDDRAAVDENARRKLYRAQFNAAVKTRNDARRKATILIILPITAAGG